ncbi:MAG: F0F1 ATP synthase subunit gamma [Acidobacteriota bacterium]|nr:F0F1 ATP synthase subunit gamma [Acidobacteriota bacterium]
MANILDIRRRIRSVRNTRQITKAMQMVSAARLRRAQERALAARPYAQMLTNVLKSLVSRAEVYDPETGVAKHPLLARRPERNILLIVVTGEKGLAGAFNTNILKAAARFLESKAGKTVEIVAVGRKGRDFFKRRYSPLPKTTQKELKIGGSMQDAQAGSVEQGERVPPGVYLTAEHVGILNKLEYRHAAELTDWVIERYTKEEIDSVYVAFNEFKSVISQRLVVEEVLPVEEIGVTGSQQTDEMSREQRERAAEAAERAGVSVHKADTTDMDRAAATFATAQVDYIYEQTPDELFRSLLPKYVVVQVFRALLESIAAEHAARMTAMDSATNNASDMIDSLTLVMNRARQAKITKEIIEIVSGAAAL